MPHPKTKGWEFTDISGLDLDAYETAEPSVVVEGGSDAVTILRLSDPAAAESEILQEHLGTLVPASEPFVARNDAGWTDGVLIHVPAGVRVEEPIRIELTHDSSGAAVIWRTLVVVEEGAEAEVWESWESDSDENDGLLNAVTELRVGAAGRLRYICRQELSTKSWVFASQRGAVGRDGHLDWVALGFGSKAGKVRMETTLDGQGSEARVTGAYAGAGRQHLDYDTRQEHAAPNTISDLAFRGVLGDRSTSVWRGMIRVDEGAQQTDAFQDNRNMLLTRKAHADAIPGLEIEANDVRCTHAAAVAQIDPDQLFYLTSRGLDEDQSKRLVIEAFLQSLVERLHEGPIRDSVSEALERRLEVMLG